MTPAPDFVTHYHLGGRGPFLNLSELDEVRLAVVLRDLNALRDAGLQHRPFGRRYMALRQLTEQRLHSLFVSAGGHPERRSPHYFVLGDSPWYQSLAADMKAVRIPMSALPPEQTSVTYPDSVTAMGCGESFGLKQTQRPYHNRVFLLHELDDLVRNYGIPSPAPCAATSNWRKWPEDTFIEVQLWSDGPVRGYLPTCP